MINYMKRSQSGEDDLECVLRLSEANPVVHLIDVAKKMNVSQAAVNKAVKILIEEGYIKEDGKHLVLTKSGEKYAQAVFEKHCIIRNFLMSHGVSPDPAEEDACLMEHLVSDETFQKMKEKCN